MDNFSDDGVLIDDVDESDPQPSGIASTSSDLLARVRPDGSSSAGGTVRAGQIRVSARRKK